jgi:hypothetical protein
VSHRRCPICNRWVSVNRSGSLRAHVRPGARHENCPERAIAKRVSAASALSVVSVSIAFGPGKVFRCDVPMALTSAQQSEVRAAIRMVCNSVQSAWGSEDEGASLPKPEAE